MWGDGGKNERRMNRLKPGTVIREREVEVHCSGFFLVKYPFPAG